ncbi:hypothetical protein [Pseudomonas sp. UBA6323]|uniref:hypothetical protein n=1 Tax=Pseudomonas sp. UBA6323 TaxID=1947329 RepID=UPI0025E97A62|nr:hypothetical protein [Pseudomonas sp. UBA6323]
MNIKDFMDMMKDELHKVLNDGDQDDEQEDEFPPFHRSLNRAGFARLSPEAQAVIGQKLAVVDPDYDGWDGEIGEVCQIKRLQRDTKLSCSLELYRKMSVIDPDSVPGLKFRGKLVVDAAKVAEQDNEQLAQLLAPHLPAYLLKRNGEEISAFEITSPENLEVLANNVMYETYLEFDERDTDGDAEVDFINHLVYDEDVHLNVQFPSLGGHILFSSGQIFIGAIDESGLKRMEEVLQPLGTFDYRADEDNDDQDDD